MTVDIIIPVYNESDRIKDHLTSLGKAIQSASATGMQFKVIVVDGGSSDDSVELAEKFDVQLIKSPRGRGSQIASGFANSSGDIVIMLHADSIVHEDALLKFSDKIRHEPNAGWGIFGHGYDKKSLRMANVRFMNRLRFNLAGIAFGDQGIFVKRKIIETRGGIPSIPLMEDVEISLRLRSVPRVSLGESLTLSSRRWDNRIIFAYSFQMIYFVLWYVIGRKLGFDIQKIAKKLYLKYYKKRAEKNTICIFSKPPIAGMTKSRLAKSIGEAAAADLAAAMLQDIIEQALAVQNAQVILAHPPENNPAEFKFLKYSGINFIAQNGADLGERMSNVFADLLTRQNPGKVIIIGSDCITVSSEELQTSFENLSKFSIIIEPATDGGYVLVGQSVFCVEIFNDIAWGTDVVMEQTRKQLDKAKVDFLELPPSFDIDHYADLSKLANFLQYNSRPRTKQVVERLHLFGN